MPRQTSIPSRGDFEAMGFQIMRKEQSRAGRKTRKRRFISWFGAEPVFLAITWRKLQESGWLDYAGCRPEPVHLLWAFMWLKNYEIEDVGAGIAGVDEKTFREKVWFYVQGVARLDTTVVSSCCCYCHWFESTLIALRLLIVFFSLVNHRFNGPIVSLDALDNGVLSVLTVSTFQFRNQPLGLLCGGPINSMDLEFDMNLQSALPLDGLLDAMGPLSVALGQI